MEINKITFSKSLSHGSSPWEAQGLRWTLPPLPLSVQRRCAWTSSARQVGLTILCFLPAREMSLSPLLPSTQDQCPPRQMKTERIWMTPELGAGSGAKFLLTLFL